MGFSLFIVLLVRLDRSRPCTFDASHPSPRGRLGAARSGVCSTCVSDEGREGTRRRERQGFVEGLCRGRRTGPIAARTGRCPPSAVDRGEERGVGADQQGALLL